jgi:hypothetical protein
MEPQSGRTRCRGLTWNRSPGPDTSRAIDEELRRGLLTTFPDAGLTAVIDRSGGERLCALRSRAGKRR